MKNLLLIIGLLAMVVLISSSYAARDLVESSSISRTIDEVVKNQNDIAETPLPEIPKFPVPAAPLPKIPKFPVPAAPLPKFPVPAAPLPKFPVPAAPLPKIPGFPFPSPGSPGFPFPKIPGFPFPVPGFPIPLPKPFPPPRTSPFPPDRPPIIAQPTPKPEPTPGVPGVVGEMPKVHGLGSGVPKVAGVVVPSIRY